MTRSFKTLRMCTGLVLAGLVAACSDTGPLDLPEAPTPALSVVDADLTGDHVLSVPKGAFTSFGSVALVAFANNGGRVLTLNLKGTGAMYERSVPDIEGDGQDDDAICFDVQLFDLSTGHQIGTATDCLANIAGDGDGLNLVGTTFFKFNGGATLVTRGVTTVHPDGVGSLSPFTHVTGAVPSGGNDILLGTNQFNNATGSVRLSGLVDMTNFGANVGDPITFDCVFVVVIDR